MDAECRELTQAGFCVLLSDPDPEPIFVKNRPGSDLNLCEKPEPDPESNTSDW